jgi:hypothetical protein
MTRCPPIAGTVGIVGNGATLARSGAAATPSFRLIEVSSGGRLVADSLTLTNRDAEDSFTGGAILNSATTVLSQSRVTANQMGAQTGQVVDAGAGVSNKGGTMYLIGDEVGNNLRSESP